jgi:KDO2-lipid IV(A) lauroyltransferase
MAEPSTSVEAEPFGSKWSIRFGLFLARRLPRWGGYAVAKWGGRLVGLLSPRRRAIIESNLAQVLKSATPRRRRAVAVEVFGHAARSYYECVYLPQIPPEGIIEMATFEEPGWTLLQEAYEKGNGVIVVTTHQSSVDLAGQAIAARGMRIGVLILPTPAESFLSLNEIREAQGLETLPVGPLAVRKALRLLREGGILVVGGDRPVKGQGTIVDFFGRPTLLPDGHARLALRTQAAVFCGYVRLEDGRYYVRFRPVEVARGGTKDEDLLTTSQRIAHVLEEFIQTHPEQWHLFIRLWD